MTFNNVSTASIRSHDSLLMPQGRIAIDDGPPAARSLQLAAVNLKKSYRKAQVEIPVLRGVDLEVRHGEFLSIVGQSGSGKSTLLHLCATLGRAGRRRNPLRRGPHRQPAAQPPRRAAQQDNSA